MLNALTAALQGSIPTTPSIHRLRRGLPGYLILFAPHAFAPQRQYWPRSPPSPLVFLPISTNFTSTPGIPRPSSIFKRASFVCTSSVEPRAFTSNLTRRQVRFTPNDSEQRLHPPYYRGCWHGVSRCLLRRYRQASWMLATRCFFPPQRALRPEGLHHSGGMAGSGLRPLPNIPHCCLP